MSYDDKIADPHHHLWDLSKGQNDWLLNPNNNTLLGDYTSICHDYLISDYLKDADTLPLSSSVFIQAGWTRTDPLGEIAWVQSITDQHNLSQGIVGYANFTDKNIESHLDQVSQFANARGIRQIVSWDQDSYYSGCEKDFLSSDLWQKNLSLLTKYNLSFDLQIFPEQIDTAAACIAKNPDLPFILNHCGMPKHLTSDYLPFWEKQITKLAKLPNVSTKISGFSMFNRIWTIDMVRPFVEKTIEHFGADRTMFASNFPVEKLAISFTELFSRYKIIAAQYSDSEQKQLFLDNTIKIYRL